MIYITKNIEIDFHIAECLKCANFLLISCCQ